MRLFLLSVVVSWGRRKKREGGAKNHDFLGEAIEKFKNALVYGDLSPDCM